MVGLFDRHELIQPLLKPTSDKRTWPCIADNIHRNRAMPADPDTFESLPDAIFPR
jgi:hypothetical protein